MKILIFDTETTGLPKSKLVPLDRQPQIIELFAISYEDEKEISTFDAMFNPGKPLDKKITQITGISDEMLTDKPAFSERAEEIKALIEDHELVVAHNLSFDMAMVNFEINRCNKAVAWPRPLCTVEATIHIKGHRLNLNALHNHLFGEDFTGAHRAETDVRALARCFFELRKTGVV